MRNKRLSRCLLSTLLAVASLVSARDAGFGLVFAEDPPSGVQVENTPTPGVVDAAQSARDAIAATGDDRYIVLPQESSYLSSPKTLYVDRLYYDWWTPTIIKNRRELAIQQKICGPAVPVERISELHTGRQGMPWAYEGTRVTVLAEENDMSCIVYLSSENVLRAGWVQSRFLVSEFPGETLSVGNSSQTGTTVNDVTLSWSKKGFLNQQQNYSVLSRTIENCIGFTLEYQLIQENTNNWDNIFGPRTIYVNDGIDWIRVGSFEYPEHGTVRVNVSLEKPTNIVAIGTVAEVPLPNTFRFRQNAEDFLVVG